MVNSRWPYKKKPSPSFNANSTLIIIAAAVAQFSNWHTAHASQLHTIAFFLKLEENLLDYLYNTIPCLNSIATFHWYSSFAWFDLCSQLSTCFSTIYCEKLKKHNFELLSFMLYWVSIIIMSYFKFKPIRMLIDANIIFVWTKYSGIATWCCIYEQMEFDAISNFIELIWLRWPHENRVFTCA